MTGYFLGKRIQKQIKESAMLTWPTPDIRFTGPIPKANLLGPILLTFYILTPWRNKPKNLSRAIQSFKVTPDHRRTHLKVFFFATSMTRIAPRSPVLPPWSNRRRNLTIVLITILPLKFFSAIKTNKIHQWELAKTLWRRRGRRERS